MPKEDYIDGYNAFIPTFRCEDGHSREFENGYIDAELDFWVKITADRI